MGQSITRTQNAESTGTCFPYNYPEIEIKYQVREVSLRYDASGLANDGLYIRSSQSAMELIYGLWNKDNIGLVEEFKVLLLNRANRVLGIHTLSRGSSNACIVDRKLLFVTALKANASAVIVAHNHPSNNVKPSTADEKLTKELVAGGELLGISVLDHIIVTPTPENYFSFSDNAML